SRHYAFEGRCFVLAVGSILRVRDVPPELPVRPEKAGDPDALLYRGGSAIFAPDGRFLAGPVYDEETVVVADCDLAEITRESLTLDVSGHYSRPDVFEFRVRGEEGRGRGKGKEGGRTRPPSPFPLPPAGADARPRTSGRRR
ncbi:MAG: nitrilase-related carbon-nitrogen hydrolase, partial [Candidatus Rokuibacteriota bacterium]